ncbi:spindle and kinetochore-associated protein 1-like isoform X1 [Lytechinus variegatus]|uniref:spindle and kinetochore-associated protein 1-like isoform X1 n=1 Tax=Lytechinus variegatus TaxID=7654 RepID=UPI001BB13C34|nr:spindle and kinetochore-associated protein 1-like isoform X1 [Lytechinus variegatus]
MECRTLNELKTHFEIKLTSLATCMDLVSIASEPYGVRSECHEQLIMMERDLCDAESSVASIREWVKEQQKKLEEAQILHENLKELNSRLSHMNHNLPERLPAHHKHVQRQPSSQENHLPLQSKPVSENTDQNTRQGSMTSKRPAKPPPAPLMDYITVPEFKDVPKYMKGRMTYDNINGAVDGFNAAMETKYRLMKRPRSGLNDRDRKQYQKYKEQENKDTKGTFFVTEDDLRRHGSLKMDSSARAALTILRHCGRMREIRGGGLTRYTVIH